MADLYYVLIQAYLFSPYGIERQELVSYMNCSFSTVSKMLSTIPESMLCKTKKGRQTFFRLELDAVDTYLEQQ